MTNKPLVQGYLAALATLMMWGAFSLISRMGGTSPLTPYDMFALRIFVGTLILLPFSRDLPWRLFTEKRLWGLALLCSPIYCLLAFSAFQLAPAAHAALLMAGTQALIVSLLSLVLFGIHPNRPRWIGLSLIMLGMICAARPYFTELPTATLQGDGLFLLAASVWSLYAVLSTRGAYSAWDLTRFIVFSSAIVYFPIYVFFLPKALAVTPIPMIVLQAGFQGIFPCVLAMQAYLFALRRLGAERTSAILALVPILVGLVAVPLLDEALSGWLLSALLLVSCGSFISARYGSTVKSRSRK